MADPDDAELVGRSRRGDRAAFAQLYQRYQRRALAFCYRLTGCGETAQDVVQTAFLKAYQSLATLDEPRLFYYWLFTIVRNEAYGQMRRNPGAGVNVSLDEAADVWEGDSPHERLEKEELHVLVERLIGRLKAEYRETLILQQYESLSYAEIAAITGDSISAVESRLFKARRKLAKYLAPYVK